MATGDYLFQVLPVLGLVLQRPAAAPGDGQRAELGAPPGPLSLPALDLSAVDPDKTKIPLLGPRWYVLRLGAIQFRRRLKRLSGAEQQGRGDRTNQSNAFYDSDKLQ